MGPQTEEVEVHSSIEVDVCPDNYTDLNQLGIYVKGRRLNCCIETKEQNGKIVIVIKELLPFLKPEHIILAIPIPANFKLMITTK